MKIETSASWFPWEWSDSNSCFRSSFSWERRDFASEALGFSSVGGGSTSRSSFSSSVSNGRLGLRRGRSFSLLLPDFHTIFIAMTCLRTEILSVICSSRGRNGGTKQRWEDEEEIAVGTFYKSILDKLIFAFANFDLKSNRFYCGPTPLVFNKSGPYKDDII